METIVLLTLSGLLLLFFEVFIPGGILGTLGALCFISASIVGYRSYGLFEGLGIFFASLFITVVFFVFQFKVLTKTSLGKAFILREKVKERNVFKGPEETVVGAVCEALTDLSPTGVVLLEGKSYEAKSQDGFIKRGAQLSVVGKERFYILVSRIKH